MTDLRSRASFRPDLGGLAREQVAGTRRALGLTTEEFASALTTVLDWSPRPEAITSWESVAIPPGDVVLAVGILRHSRPETVPAAEGDLITELVSERFADLGAVYTSRSEFLAQIPTHHLFNGAKAIRAAGLSLNMLCQHYSDTALAQLIEDGTTLDCLFLDPSGEATRQREAEEGHTPGRLATLTTMNLHAINSALRARLSASARTRLRVRVYEETLRYNLTFVDQRVAVVQPYLHQARGVDTPTFVIHRDTAGAGGLYRSFEREFNWLWGRGSNVKPD